MPGCLPSLGNGLGQGICIFFSCRKVAVAGPRSASAASGGCLGMGVLIYENHESLLLNDRMQKAAHLDPGDEEEVRWLGMFFTASQAWRHRSSPVPGF